MGCNQACSAIHFEVEGQPVGKARPRITRQGRAYTPAKTLDAEEKIRDRARQMMGPWEPITGPVYAWLHFHMEVPKSWPKKKREDALAGRIWPAGKPDADNLAKTVLDACNEVIFQDDGQVVELTVHKVYSGRPRTVVSVGKME